MAKATMSTILPSSAAGERHVRTKRVIIATGSVDSRPTVPGLDLPGVINSEQALEMEEIPASVAIIGGA